MDMVHMDRLIQGNGVISRITCMPGSDLTPEYLSKLWNIPLKNAKQILNSTSYEYMILLDGSAQRRVKIKVHRSAYNQLDGYLSHFSSDTFESNVTSL